jgi:hypothetical protein
MPTDLISWCFRCRNHACSWIFSQFLQQIQLEFIGIFLAFTSLKLYSSDASRHKTSALLHHHPAAFRCHLRDGCDHSFGVYLILAADLLRWTLWRLEWTLPVSRHTIEVKVSCSSRRQRSSNRRSPAGDHGDCLKCETMPLPTSHRCDRSENSNFDIQTRDREKYLDRQSLHSYGNKLGNQRRRPQCHIVQSYVTRQLALDGVYSILGQL